MAAAEGDANKLNRELLRWIQSLDLAYSIKNVKRDFANGFLVAEILSRYYDKDVSMHSYDNGIGVKVKKDNWEQMLRLFGKFPDLEPLAVRADVEAVIHCQNGAAVAFLVKLYHASAPPVAKSVDSAEDIPPYAKPTGSAAIREKMRDPDIAETSDETQISRKVRMIHNQHEEALQLERLMAETPESPALIAQQVVKEVQIKSMNETSLEKLRMTREAKESEVLGSTAHSSSISGASFELHGGKGAFSVGAAGASAAELVQKRKPMDLLSEAVARALSSADVVAKLEQRGKDKFESFIDAMSDGRHFSDAECAEVLGALVGEAGLVASAFVDFPREFWKFIGLIFPLLSENDSDHVLFRSLLERAPLLRIVYSFVPDSVLAHIQVIKRLREALPDNIPAFIHALSILLFMERALDDTMVDLYHYYCCIGLETTCEKLHTDTDLTDQIELALTIVEREFHPSASLNLRRIGLSYLAKDLSGYQELVPLYVDVLNELPIRGASGAVYELMQLPSHWDSVAVAKQIFYERKSHDQADVEAVQVLHRCFEQLHHSEGGEHAAALLYDQMRDFVVLGLLDAGSCTPAALIIGDLLASKCAAADDVFQHPALIECLQKLVTKNIDDIRQQAAVKMLRDASAVDPRSVRRCVQALRSLCDPPTFSASLFAVALDA
ncbi:hypothetical protein PybrP1_009703 [[Pythium] brassicae (nom. inval.)]|nr:hypothetical protein PybrP1_009703 [[Pythium] brassicae (nom. inval.)]